MAYAINLLLLLQTLSLQQFSSLCHALSLLAGKAFCCTFRETQRLNSGTNVLHFLPLGCKERRGQLMTNGDNGNGNQRLHSFCAGKYWLCTTQTQRILIVGHWAYRFPYSQSSLDSVEVSLESDLSFWPKSVAICSSQTHQA